jgi:hypothetical protein
MLRAEPTRHALRHLSEDDPSMVYPQTWLVFALVFLLLAGAACFRALRLSATSAAWGAWARMITLLVAAISATGLYFWSQHTDDENAAFNSAHGLAQPAPLHSSVVGAYAFAVLAAAGFLALQLGLFLRARRRDAHPTSPSSEAIV